MSTLRRYLEQQRALYGDAVTLDRPAKDVLDALSSAAGGSGQSSHPAPEQTAHRASARRAAPERDASSVSAARTSASVPSGPTPPVPTHGDGVRPEWRESGSIDELYARICGCMRCPLGSTRRNFVFGVGNPSADIVVVGEAPGADEDERGEPFVGRAGQLLNKILEAIQLRRDEVYICNILKCRPPGNRDPQAHEVEQCEPFLHAQLALIRPKIMLALGRIAGQTLLRTNESLAALRSRVHRYQGIPLMVTYHPAALLRNPNWKAPTWEDVQRFRALYDELRGTGGGGN